MQGDPAHVPSHDLGDHAAVVGLAGGAQPVDCLGGDLHGGVEAEGVVRGVEVVVDGLGHAHDLEAGVGEPLCGGQGALAADGDDGVDPEPVHVGFDDLGTAAVLKRVGAGRAQDGAALLGDAADHGAGNFDDVALDNAAPAVLESYELLAVDRDAFEDGATDDGVQAGAVSAAGEDSNFHVLAQILV